MVDPKRIWSSPHLPSLPTVAVQLLELSKQADLEIRDVVEVIRMDPAISAKILKATNSSYFGLTTQVTAVERAVPLLGTTMVTSLALSFSLVQDAVTDGPVAEHYRNYWAQSVVQAVTAELICDAPNGGVPCEYFLAGLLLDLGRLAMLKTIPAEYATTIELASSTLRPLRQVEAERLGFDHVEVGVHLMEDWRLPEAVVRAVANHHEPRELLRDWPDAVSRPLVHATAVASAAGDYFCDIQKGGALKRLRSLAKEFLGMDEARLNSFLGEIKSRVDEACNLFSVDSDLVGDPSDLMAMANEQLANLAMRQHAATAQARVQQETAERARAVLEEKTRQLEKQACRDSLTQIYNRQFFNEALEKELYRCGRTASSIGAIFADIDHFKKLNDTYGHQFGDQVLVRVAKLLNGSLRKSDVLARYGGEEFVILIVEPSEKGLEKVAERLRMRVEEEPFEHDGSPVRVTMSIGTAIAIPSRTDEGLGERIVAAADEAMYVSKRNGRNQVNARSLLKEDERRLLQLSNSLKFSRWLVQRGASDVPTLSKLLPSLENRRVRIGELAIEQQMLVDETVEAILVEQVRTGGRFGEVGITLEILSEKQVAQLLAIQQEDPAILARTLILQGSLEATEAASLLEAYAAENDLCALGTSQLKAREASPTS